MRDTHGTFTAHCVPTAPACTPAHHMDTTKNPWPPVLARASCSTQIQRYQSLCMPACSPHGQFCGTFSWVVKTPFPLIACPVVPIVGACLPSHVTHQRGVVFGGCPMGPPYVLSCAMSLFWSSYCILASTATIDTLLRRCLITYCTHHQWPLHLAAVYSTVF